MKRCILLGSLVVIVASQSGCGTIFGNFMVPCIWGSCCSEPETRIYGGVRLHAEEWQHRSSEAFAARQVSTLDIMWYWLISVIDIPLSFVADTLTLPITVPIELSR